LFPALAALFLAGCAIFAGPRTVTVPPAQLQTALARRFPIDVRYMKLFDLHATRPVLAIEPDDGRVALTMDVVIAPPFVRRWQGSITVSGVPTADDSRREIVLDAPRLDAFRIDGFDPAMSREITRYGADFAAQVLRRVPLATYDELRPAFLGADAVPAKAAATRAGLVVTFAPAQ